MTTEPIVKHIGLTQRQLNTVLAALRLWREAFEDVQIERKYLDIATNSGQDRYLDVEDIDTLCKEINCHRFGVFEMLDCSVAHVSAGTRDWIQDRGFGDDISLPVVAAGKYGWILYVPETKTDLEDEIAGEGDEDPWPADLGQVIRLAQDRGCDYVYLDADGMAWDGLPTYED